MFSLLFITMTELNELGRLITELLSEDEELEDSGDSYSPSSESLSDENEEITDRRPRNKAKKRVPADISTTATKSKPALMPIDLPSTSTAGAHQTTSNDEVHLPINPVGEEVIIDQVTNTKPPPVKRRKRDVSSWKSQKRYISHQKGESYVSRRGVVEPAKEVKSLKDCLNDCKFKCGVSISENERQALFKAFYGMNQNGKHQYLGYNHKISVRKT
ncbi:uncharacterized protein LOC126881937 [Diabrotica virgifera virgifera]|uniref:Uncharacterized protein n=1 Tax=Diabrotica virgifera virgifera TaxID=50390 RepID=A0ABM5JXG6_DIAVI|nr:uncharacterized protein LOC126881937 [Diabrotica virgifera virgifera]